jgi:hypothetical protein
MHADAAYQPQVPGADIGLGVRWRLALTETAAVQRPAAGLQTPASDAAYGQVCLCVCVCVCVCESGCVCDLRICMYVCTCPSVCSSALKLEVAEPRVHLRRAPAGAPQFLLGAAAGGDWVVLGRWTCRGSTRPRTFGASITLCIVLPRDRSVTKTPTHTQYTHACQLYASCVPYVRRHVGSTCLAQRSRYMYVSLCMCMFVSLYVFLSFSLSPFSLSLSLSLFLFSLTWRACC